MASEGRAAQSSRYWRRVLQGDAAARRVCTNADATLSDHMRVASPHGICTTQEEDKIALDDPDFWEKTLGKDALKQKKEIVDTTQRKAKQGDKEYVHNYGPVDRSRNGSAMPIIMKMSRRTRRSSIRTTGARRKLGSCG